MIKKSFCFFCQFCRLHAHPHCGVRCGPHRTVRTAPALKAKKLPHNHNFPTIHFNLFCQIFGQKNFQKTFSKAKKKLFWALFFHFWGGVYYLILCIFLQSKQTNYYLITSEWLAAQHWIVKLKNNNYRWWGPFSTSST